MHALAPRPSPRARRRGVALLSVVPALVFLVVLMVAFVGVTIDGSRWTSRRVDLFSARIAADTATRLAVEGLWSEFEQSRGGAGARITDVRVFLDGIGITNQATEARPADVQLLPRLGLPTDANGENVIGDTVIEGVQVQRHDELRSTRLVFTTTAVARRGDERYDAASSRETITDVFVIEPPAYEGLDFVLLANNINCLMCHTAIDNVERVYNVDEARRGQFARVRTGSIESFHFRADPESTIAGTLYLGRDARGEHGELISDWAGLSLDSYRFDAEGSLVEGVGGVMTAVDLAAADPDAPEPYGNLYLDYFAHEGDDTRYQVDGEMPDDFPLPFPDDGGFDPATLEPTLDGAFNRVVDDNEFVSTLATAKGTASGGNIGVVAIGDRVGSGAALSSLRAEAATLSGHADGHVYMHGTEADPVVLSGELAISGDLVLSGVVKGSANVKVKGNVYVTGDLEYADAELAGTRTFGRSADGTKNILTIAAGKNIVVGDMYHPRWGSGAPANGQSDGSWNFTMDQLAIFNRMEWMKTQPTLPGEPTYELVRTTTEPRELFEEVEVTREEPVYTWQGTGTFADEAIYEERGTGVFDTVPVYEWQVTGTEEVPVYTTVVHPADPPEPYGSPWTEQVLTGYRTEPVYGDVQVGTQSVERTEWVQVGTRSVEVYAWVETGTRTVTETVTQSYSPPRFLDEPVEEWQWVTPQHPNPYYAGPDFLPRYYAFSEDTPVPIFNKVGYFDPDSQLWIAPELPGRWDEDAVTFADQGDTSEPLLYDGLGDAVAVVSTLSPTGGWLDDTLLRGLVEENYAARDSSRPLAVDAWLYSSNSVFGVVPTRGAVGVEGRMRVNGAVIAADVGLLAPNGMELNFDRRGRDRMSIKSQTRVAIRRALWAPGSRARTADVLATLGT